MSLAIEAADVTAVLLADGWHDVTARTFLLDSYEFLDGTYVLHGGGQSGISATGFQFHEQDTNHLVAGPLTAIHAVRHSPDEEDQ